MEAFGGSVLAGAMGTRLCFHFRIRKIQRVRASSFPTAS